MRSKDRLTITLSRDLVREIDRLVADKSARSRSHAIETLIRKSLKPTVNQAVILAGGGRRQEKLPPLATIDNQALIALLIGHLVDYGIEEIFVLAGRNEPAIRALISGGEQAGADLHYIGEEEPLGTAGALKLAEPNLGGGSILAVHADILTDIDLSDFVDFHLAQNTLATIAVKPRSAERNYGKVLLQGNKITHFYGKSGNLGISLINTGVYLFKSEMLSLIDKNRPSSLEADVFPKLAAMGELSAFLFQGVWFDISTPESYRQAQLRWAERSAAVRNGRASKA